MRKLRREPRAGRRPWQGNGNLAWGRVGKGWHLLMTVCVDDPESALYPVESWVPTRSESGTATRAIAGGRAGPLRCRDMG